MKKKPVKKLQLEKIRVASLSDAQQQKLNGGAFTAECPSGFRTCATCGATCGTRLC
ncbi:class I lanthipeptide [Chitinophaga solisilvae]|uniref:Uncharacterized protein n=1 Tax=Chitinophaga solisilvae TaxID=1233460 RepID=A0A9Q5D1B4_9BACT|nr:class I lanthipeptide [Chitinophaga solisilvae]NSL86244.1 hypothetical protein [Chitinophaga solisilvae]